MSAIERSHCSLISLYVALLCVSLTYTLSLFITNLAPPSTPSRVKFTRYQSNSVYISFSVEEGSLPITHFLINTSSVGSSEPPTQTVVAITDNRFIFSLDEVVDSESGRSVYRVVLVLSRLENQRDYLFQVAAESSLGRGEFSEQAAFRLSEFEFSCLTPLLRSYFPFCVD